MRFILDGQPHRLMICTVENRAIRGRAIRAVNDLSESYEIWLIDFVTTGRLSLYGAIKSRLEQRESESEASSDKLLVHLFNLNQRFYTMESGSLATTAIFDNLNFEREKIFRELNCVLILWMDKDDLRLIQRHAMDFFDWVTNVFHFKSDREVTVLRDPQMLRDGDIGTDRAESRHDIARLCRRLQMNAEDGNDHDRLDTMILLADAFINSGEYSSAIGTLKSANQLIQIHPEFDPNLQTAVLRDLANAYLHASDFEKAFHAAKNLETHSSESSDFNALSMSYLLQARSSEGLGKINDAIEFYFLTIKRRDAPLIVATAHHELAALYASIGKHNAALEHFEAALEYNEQWSRDDVTAAYIHHNLGNVLKQLEKFDQAVEQYKLAEMLGVKAGYLGMVAVSSLAIAQVHSQTERYELAIVAVERAIEIWKSTNENSRLAVCYQLKGFILSNLEQYDTAIEFLEKAIRHRKSDEQRQESISGAYVALASIFGKLGKQEESILQLSLAWTESQMFDEEETKTRIKATITEFINSNQKAFSTEARKEAQSLLHEIESSDLESR